MVIIYVYIFFVSFWTFFFFFFFLFCLINKHKNTFSISKLFQQKTNKKKKKKNSENKKWQKLKNLYGYSIIFLIKKNCKKKNNKKNLNFNHLLAKIFIIGLSKKISKKSVKCKQSTGFHITRSWNCDRPPITRFS